MNKHRQDMKNCGLSVAQEKEKSPNHKFGNLGIIYLLEPCNI